MSETSLQSLIARRNRQEVLGAHNINGVQYEMADGKCGWHITAWTENAPVNVYWVIDGRFYAVKIHLLTDPHRDIQLEVFDEISYIVPAERACILKAIAAWDA